jgi:hypothetical protein
VSRLKVGRQVHYPDGSPVPTVFLSGGRATVAATDASSAETAIPTGAQVIAVRASVCVWIRWGATGMDPAAEDDDSQLFPPGEAVIPVPIVDDVLATHFRVLREGATDGYVQVEQINHAGV